MVEVQANKKTVAGELGGGVVGYVVLVIFPTVVLVHGFHWRYGSSRKEKTENRFEYFRSEYRVTEERV